METRRSKQEAQIMAALQAAPLDRLRLMKTLFLHWHRTGRPPDGPFEFRPYLYGPCAFDLYDALDRMSRGGKIVRAPHPVSKWAAYRLTRSGAGEATSSPAVQNDHRIIGPIANSVSQQSFRSLLESVYEEAPDFATKFVFAEEIDR